MRKIKLLVVFAFLFASLAIFAEETDDSTQDGDEPAPKVVESAQKSTNPAQETVKPAREVAKPEQNCPVCPVCPVCPTCPICPTCQTSTCPDCPECRSLVAGIVSFLVGLILAIFVFALMNKCRLNKSKEKQQAETSISEMQLETERNEKDEISKKLRSVEREKAYLEEEKENVERTLKRNNEKLYTELSSNSRWDNVVDMFIGELVKKEYKDGIKVGIESFSVYFDKFSSAVRNQDYTTALEAAKQFVAEYEKLSNEYKEEA